MQRPGAHEHNLATDGAGLRLQRDLRRAKAEHAGKLPALYRHQPVGRARRDDECVIGNRIRNAVAERVTTWPSATFQARWRG